MLHWVIEVQRDIYLTFADRISAFASGGSWTALDAFPADGHHPHLRDAVRTGRGLKHAHAFLIDDVHREYPA